jgi:hypothetical protein
MAMASRVHGYFVRETACYIAVLTLCSTCDGVRRGGGVVACENFFVCAA